MLPEAACCRQVKALRSGVNLTLSRTESGFFDIHSPSNGRVMPPSSVRRLFIAALVVLPIQYALVGVVGHYASEPWPTLVLPAFQTTWERDASIQVEQVALDVAFEDGTRVPVAVESLLADLPRSQHRGFFRSQCQPARLSGTARTERCLQPSAASWVKQQAVALFPARSPDRLDVIWNRLVYTLPRLSSTPHSTVKTVPLDTLSITWRPSP